MELAVVTILLLGITLVCFVWGTIGLSRYAFRLGTGPGLMVLLLPPYTFYFAFYKLDQESKDRPTALWAFGLIASLLLILVFQAVLRVPYFVGPTPEDNSVIEVNAGEKMEFDVEIYDLDSPGALARLEGVENLPGAKFEKNSGGNGNAYKFTWEPTYKNTGEFMMSLVASDFTNEVKRPLKLKVNCDDKCKAAKKAAKPKPTPQPSTGGDAAGTPGAGGTNAGGTNAGTNAGGTNAGTNAGGTNAGGTNAGDAPK